MFTSCKPPCNGRIEKQHITINVKLHPTKKFKFKYSNLYINIKHTITIYILSYITLCIMLLSSEYSSSLHSNVYVRYCSCWLIWQTKGSLAVMACNYIFKGAKEKMNMNLSVNLGFRKNCQLMSTEAGLFTNK